MVPKYKDRAGFSKMIVIFVIFTVTGPSNNGDVTRDVTALHYCLSRTSLSKMSSMGLLVLEVKSPQVTL